MARARMGDTARVHCEGRLADGIPFANSADRKPLEVKIGSHDLLPAFEEAIIGMEPEEPVLSPCGAVGQGRCHNRHKRPAPARSLHIATFMSK